MFYEKVNNKIICSLCRHHCKLALNQIGYCGVNKNTNNSLDTLVYGYIGGANIDPIEKKPLFHFLPKSKSFSIGTVGCNFRCPFCQNWEISQSSKIDTDKYFLPEEIVNMAKNTQCKSIAFTYNEPTIFYPYAKDISIKAKEFDIKSIFVSNGYESAKVIKDMKGIIDGVNIDLKSFNDVYYKKTLKGKKEWVLDTIIELKKQDIWVEITTLLIDDINSDKDEIYDICKFIYQNVGDDTPLHFSAFHPDYKMKEHSHTKIETLKRAYDIAKNVKLKHIYLGNIQKEQFTLCSNCQNPLIKRNGYKVELLNNTSICNNCSFKLEGIFDD